MKLFVFLLELALWIWYLSDFQKDLFDPFRINCWQNLWIQIINRSLHKLSLFLHEKVSIYNLSFLLMRLLTQAHIFSLYDPQLFNDLIILLVYNFFISLTKFKFIYFLTHLCVEVRVALKLFYKFIVFCYFRLYLYNSHFIMLIFIGKTLE